MAEKTWSIPTHQKHISRVKTYRISLVIRQSFFSFQNNPKNLDPSYKMDLDFKGCLEWQNLLVIYDLVICSHFSEGEYPVL